MKEILKKLLRRLGRVMLADGTPSYLKDSRTGSATKVADDGQALIFRRWRGQVRHCLVLRIVGFAFSPELRRMGIFGIWRRCWKSARRFLSI